MSQSLIEQSIAAADGNIVRIEPENFPDIRTFYAATKRILSKLGYENSVYGRDGEDFVIGKVSFTIISLTQACIEPGRSHIAFRIASPSTMRIVLQVSVDGGETWMTDSQEFNLVPGDNFKEFDVNTFPSDQTVNLRFGNEGLTDFTPAFDFTLIACYD